MTDRGATPARDQEIGGMVQDLTAAVREFDNALAIIARSSPTLEQRP